MTGERSAVDTARKARQFAQARRAFLGTGAVVGARPRLLGRQPVISNEGQMQIGERLRMRCGQFTVSLSTGSDGLLVIGARVLLNQGATVHAERSVTLGDDVLVGDLVAIYDTDFHPVHEDVPVRVAPVVIGNNVWLGRGAIVLAGSRIGDHAVVGAGSVVSGVVPPRAVVAGAPARRVGDVRCSDGFRRP